MAIHTFCRQHLAVCLFVMIFAIPCHADMTGSSVTSHAPQPVASNTFELVVEVTGESSDDEYIDRFTIQLPTQWTINQVVAPPANTEPICTGTALAGWTPANWVYWQKNTGFPSNCGLWDTDPSNNVHQFIINVTVPDCSGTPWTLDWTIEGDEWPFSDPPHSTSGTLHINTCETVSTGQEKYNFKVVDYPGALTTFLGGINSSRKIVGYYSADLVNYHGFIQEDGSFTPVDYPGATHTYPFSINDQDHIVGHYRAGGAPLCFQYLPDGSYATFAPPGAITCIATDINDNNMIVGFFTDASARTYGFTYDGSAYATFSYPASNVTMAFGINNQNQISGRYTGNETTPVEHGFRLDGSTFASFNYPGSDGTRCSRITDNGVMTGSFYEDLTASPPKLNGLLIRGDAAYSQITYPGAQMTWISDMNSRKDLVGSYSFDGMSFSGIVVFDYPWELFIPSLSTGQDK